MKKTIGLPYPVVGEDVKANKSHETIQIRTENAVAQWYRHI